MKRKLLPFMDTTKKKLSIALLCGALVTTLGAGTVYAANENSPTSLLVKMKNGVKTFSTDDGKTWSQNAPNGVTMNQDKDGKVTISNGIPPKDGEGKGLMGKVENGVRSYSTDGGKTWSQNPPDGVTVNENKEGKVIISNGLPPLDGKGKRLMVKEVNGVRSYSTDGGKTWSQNPPDGVAVNEDKDGKVTISNGIPPKDGEGKGLLVKEVNGVRSYSTDGGKTWSQNAPDGAEDSSTIGNDY